MPIYTENNILMKHSEGSNVVHAYRQREHDRKELGFISRGVFHPSPIEMTGIERACVDRFIESLDSKEQ